MKLRPLRLVPVLALFAAVPALAPVAAPAQVDDLRAQAEALNADLERTGAEIAELGEQLDATQTQLDRAEAGIASAQERIDSAKARIDELSALVAERAAAVYRTAGTSGPFEAIDIDNTTDAGARTKYANTANDKDEALVAELAATREDLEAEREAASAARERAQRERDELAAAKEAADAAAAEQQALLDQVEGDIESELARITAEQAARAPQVTDAPADAGNEGGDQGGGGGAAAPAPAAPSGPPPMGHGGGGAAAGYASAQVGKPYCNTNPDRFGPNCYDCSGLTYSSWQAGGLTIPPVSGSQGAAYPHVPLDQLQPGDLITTSSWGAHVGIWVGGGYVHATKPGDVVKFVGGTGSVIDAVRPS